ncbi:type I restriction endonuclease [Escherichia coli]|nr:type I restriction endonuclease [Escherichia coli]
MNKTKGCLIANFATVPFKELGYQYQNGYDIAPDGDMPERENYQQVTLQARLVSALETLNPNVPSDTLIEVAKIVATPQTPVLIKNNKLFHQYLIEGVPVEYSVMEQEQWVTKHTHVRLIDFVLWSTKTGHRVRVFPVSVF